MKNNGIGKKKLIALLIFIAAVAAIYLNSIQNEFVFDDKPLIVRNESIRDPSNILDIFNYDDSKAMSYRPIRFISFAIDYAISGESPVGYHISNMIYHVISGYILFILINFMLTNVPWMKAGGDDDDHFFTSYLISVFCAVIFLTHPVQVDSVAYISGRRDVLSTLFFLLAFLSYLKFRYLNKKWHLALVVFFYAVAISAKEMAITLPIVIFAFEIVENMTSKSDSLFADFWASTKSSLNKYKFILIPLFIFAAAFTWYSVVYREASHQINWYSADHKISWHGGNILLHFLTVIKIWMTYLRLIFLPVTLNADYRSYPISTSLFETMTMLSIAGFILLFYVTLKALKKNKIVGFGLLWYIITLLPVSQIIPHHELMAEHYLYLPIIGFVIVLAGLLRKTESMGSFAKPVAAILCVITLLYSGRVIVRNQDWKTEKILWKKTAETDPMSHRAWFNLGNIYREEFMFESAVINYQKAIEVTNDKNLKAKSYNSIGAILLKQRAYQPAVAQFMESLALDPDYVPTLNNLAALYLETNDLEKAEMFLKKVIEKMPDFLEAKVNYAILKYKKGDKELAKAELDGLMTANPANLTILNVLAKISMEEGRTDDAKRYYEDIILFNPDGADAHFNLGNIYYSKEFLDLAVGEFIQAVTKDPGFYAAHLNLGNIYAVQNNSEKALIFYGNAAKVKPNNPAPHLGLAKLYLEQLKDYGNAKRELEKCLELDPNQPGALEIQTKIKQIDEHIKNGG